MSPTAAGIERKPHRWRIRIQEDNGVVHYHEDFGFLDEPAELLAFGLSDHIIIRGRRYSLTARAQLPGKTLLLVVEPSGKE